MLSPQVSVLSHTQCRELGCRRRYNHLPSCGKRLVTGGQSCEKHKGTWLITEACQVGTGCSLTPGFCFSDAELYLLLECCSLPVTWLQLTCSSVSVLRLSLHVILILTFLCFVFLTFPEGPLMSQNYVQSKREQVLSEHLQLKTERFGTSL